MKPLKKGDYVAAYHNGDRDVGCVHYVCTVQSDVYDVRLEDGRLLPFHRKQLRKINRKPKPLEVYINVYPDGSYGDPHMSEQEARAATHLTCRTARFCEVK